MSRRRAKPTRATVVYYQMRSGRWQWRLVAPNGKNIARGSAFRGWATESEVRRNFAATRGYLRATVSFRVVPLAA